jgi:diguanylate cyclase (GGDEF)-like protein
MLELQEQQHRRIITLSLVALAITALETWQFFGGAFPVLHDGQLSRFASLNLICGLLLLVATTLYTVAGAFRDHGVLRACALFDRQTGLPNRASFRSWVAKRLPLVQAGDALALVLLDVRRFQSLNHAYGYKTADKIVEALADRLRHFNREDVMLARLEGGTFALLMRSIQAKTMVNDLVVSLQRALATPFIIGDKNVYIDLSIGSVYCNAPGEADADELMRRAEFALHEAKAGKKHVGYCDGSAESARRVSAIESDLRETLEAEEIDIYFQPLVDSQFNKIVAVEALARWTHPQYGRVSPLDFIGVAESLGLVSQMGINILRRACIQIKPLGEVKLAVNISPRHLLMPDFVASMKTVLAETGFPAQRLELEITENVLLSDNKTTMETITAVRAMGISVALDDFGTGYSGLSYLNRFDLDRIKIDACFVREIEHSLSAQSIVASVVQLARDRGIKVTVEGVETMDQVLYLKRFGDIWYQGYLFAKPMPYSKLLESGYVTAISQSPAPASRPMREWERRYA